MAVNFEIPIERITFKGGFFDVRGMNSEDVSWLMREHIEQAKTVIAQYGQKFERGRIPTNAVTELALDLVQLFPQMAAEIISRCADAPDEWQKFQNIPVVVQAKALHAIMVLTTDDGPELKNLMGALVSLLEAKGLQLGTLGKSLQTIINSSEKVLAS